MNILSNIVFSGKAAIISVILLLLTSGVLGIESLDSIMREVENKVYQGAMVYYTPLMSKREIEKARENNIKIKQEFTEYPVPYDPLPLEKIERQAKGKNIQLRLEFGKRIPGTFSGRGIWKKLIIFGPSGQDKSSEKVIASGNFDYDVRESMLTLRLYNPRGFHGRYGYITMGKPELPPGMTVYIERGIGTANALTPMLKEDKIVATDQQSNASGEMDRTFGFLIIDDIDALGNPLSYFTGVKSIDLKLIHPR